MYASSTYSDKTLTCVDCSLPFTFSARDQEFYAERQFSEPRRCPSCRAARKAARGEGGYSSDTSYGSSSYGSGGYGGYQREMFTAVCDSCGGEARVPFRPTGAKPVYCSSCFSARR